MSKCARSWFLPKRRTRKELVRRRLQMEQMERRKLLAVDFAVTNTADSGAGSLRQAIVDANATPGADQITFAIPGTGPHTITPLSALPALTDQVTIDGYTQAGSIVATATTPATLMVELNGSMAGGGANGLYITASNSVVRGLAINRFAAQGIQVVAGDGNVIEGNHIGTNLAGTTDLGNSGRGVGIESGAANTVLGGSTPAARNIISGNSANGIWIAGEGTDNTIVAGNYVGLNATGTAAIRNNGLSIGVGYGPDNTLIGTDGDGVADAAERNVISGNQYEILILGEGTDGTVIAGNYIGTNAAGDAAIPNGGRNHASLRSTEYADRYRR